MEPRAIARSNHASPRWFGCSRSQPPVDTGFTVRFFQFVQFPEIAKRFPLPASAYFD
jgi:hypothetical protein